MKKALAIIMAVAMIGMLSVGVSGLTIGGYFDLEEMMQELHSYGYGSEQMGLTGLVIIGIGGKSETFPAYTYLEEYDITNENYVEVIPVQVTEVLYGDVQVGDIIEIARIFRLPSESDNNNWEGFYFPTIHYPSEGENYLLFLHETGSIWFGNNHQELVENRYRINHHQWSYKLNSENEIEIPNILFSSVDEVRQFFATDSEQEEPNPPTSVTLAIIPTLLAGSVAVISRKRAR